MTPNLLVRLSWTVLGMMAAFPVCGEVRITARVYDYVNLPAEVLGETKASSARVLGQAGVSVEFVECFAGGVEVGDPACMGPLGPADLILRIFDPKLAAKGEQLGYAAMTPEGGAYITV